MKNKSTFVGMVLLPLFFSGCLQQNQTSNTPQQSRKHKSEQIDDPHTSQQELDSYSEQEKKFRNLLTTFSASRDFNERNVTDLLHLIKLEIKTVDSLLFEPRWNVKKVITEKNEYLKQVIPTVKLLYTTCVSMTEQNTNDISQEFKHEYLRATKTSLKRCYSQVRSLEERTAAPPVTILPTQPYYHHEMVQQKSSLEVDQLKEEMARLKKNVEQKSSAVEEKNNFEVDQLKEEIARLKKEVVQKSNFEVDQLREEIAALKENEQQAVMQPLMSAPPTVIQVPMPMMTYATPAVAPTYLYQQPPAFQPRRQTKRSTSSVAKQTRTRTNKKILQHVDTLTQASERIDRYQRHKSLLNQPVAHTVSGQTAQVQELLSSIKNEP